MTERDCTLILEVSSELGEGDKPLSVILKIEMLRSTGTSLNYSTKASKLKAVKDRVISLLKQYAS